MNPKTANVTTRREFLGSACCAAVGATGMLSTLGSLRLMGAAASTDQGPQIPARAGAVASDYKALVCLFLNGGNDANNMIVPTGSGYAAYASARSHLALPQTSLLPISPKTSDGRTWGLHPAVPEIEALFKSGKAAFLANVGTLVYPTTKTQYNAGTIPLPPQLFAHDNQIVHWQTSVPDAPPATGWGGRVADLLHAFNTSNDISMSISLASKNTFQIGNKISQYTMGTGGATPLYGPNFGGHYTVRAAAQKDLFDASQPGLFEAAFGSAMSNAVVNADLVNQALAGAPVINTAFPDTSVGNQLRMVARLIGASPTLGLKRQIFFVQLGGFDTHAAQISDGTPTTGAHADLLTQVSQAVNAFYNATIELGVASQVTTFSASDFGRTYRSNGSGSDHGWGNHQFIVGGAVKGTDLYGKMPTLSVNGPDDIGQGRWIPTTSVDEYAATLATWFGVSATDLPTVLPNIGRFAKPNLGFIA
jgi:uncharacterized protein (DUF1501 family)